LHFLMFFSNTTLSFKRVCLLLVALTFGVTPLQFVHASEVPDSDNAAYGRALNDLAAGRTQAAIDGFSAIVARYPNHQGALLDLALAYCQGALPHNAEILFERMLASPDLPPAIQEVIKFYRLGACQAPFPVWRTMLATGFGRSQNLNQAPQSGLLYLPPLDITLQLAEKSRPQTDNVLITEAVLFRQPDSSGWGGGLFLQNGTYGEKDAFDYTLTTGLLTRRTQLGAAQVELQGALLNQQYGGHNHLNSMSLAGSAIWEGQAGLIASVAGFNYPSLPEYRSLHLDLRGRLQSNKNNAFNLVGDVGWNFDQALANRPGGDRAGPLAQITAQWAFAPNQSLEVIHRLAWKLDSKPYSTLFFGDVHRQNRQASTYVAWRYRVSKNWQWRVEGRHATSTDTVSLFTYGSSALSAMLEWEPR
jgi:hypothetical protein